MVGHAAAKEDLIHTESDPPPTSFDVTDDARGCGASVLKDTTPAPAPAPPHRGNRCSIVIAAIDVYDEALIPHVRHRNHNLCRVFDWDTM